MSGIKISCPEVIKHFSYLTQLSMNFIMLINVKNANNSSCSLCKNDNNRLYFNMLINVKVPTIDHAHRCYNITSERLKAKMSLSSSILVFKST